LSPDRFLSTLDFNVRFLKPVRPFRIVGKGRVVHRDADIAHIEAALHDADDTTIAVATAKVIPLALARKEHRVTAPTVSLAGHPVFT
jgi:acyl-coenzyme A thioesterase PaaI-like protein